MKKTFTILIAAIAAMMILQPTRLWGQEKSAYNGTFTRISSADNFVTGYYVVTASRSASSNTGYALGNAVDDNKRITGVSVTIPSTGTNAYKLVNPDEAIVYYVTKTTSNNVTTCTFKNVKTGKYIYQSSTTSGKGMGFSDDSANITLAGYNTESPIGFRFTLNGASNNYFKYNAGSKWFANYTNDYTTSMSPVDMFRLYTHSLTYNNAPTGGTVTITNGNTNVNTGSQVGEGATLNIVAAPISGYNFSGWVVTGGTIANANSTSTTFTMGTADATITATFAAGTYTITALSSNNNYGTVTLNGNVITANPAAGYTYANPAYTVTSGTATVEKNGNEFTVTPTSDCTVTINFAAIPTHTATFSVNGNTTSNTFYEGQAITFPANPSAINGKSFVGWYTEEYTHASTAPSFVDTTNATMGNSNITYYAVFAIVTTTYSETETETLQTHKYDTWTYSGTTTDMTSYRLFAENAYIESSSFDFSILKQVNVYAGTYGTLDDSKKKVTVVAGTTTWGTASLSTNSATTKNEITSSVSLSGNGQLHFVAGGGNGSGNGIRISKVEIITKKATTTITNYCTTVAATHSVTYYRNYDGDDTETCVINYDEGNKVTAAAADLFEAPTCKTFSAWNTARDGDGTSYSAVATLTNNINSNIVLYAQWRDIVYHVSFSVNGEIVSERNVDYNTAIGALPEDPELAPLTFLGWSSTSATGATNVTASWKPTGTNEDVTVYAVFGNMSTDYFTLTGTTTNIPTGYASYTWEIDDEDYFQTYNVMQGQFSTNKFIQYKSNGGYLYNIKDFGKIKSIVVTYYTDGGNNSSREIAIRINDEKFSGASGGTVMSVDYSGDVYTFTYDDEHYDYHYFSIYNSSTTSTIASIRINYEAAAPLTVNIIDANADMSTDIEATTCVVVKDGATLNFTGENNGNANNLVIEDGGQLILPTPTAKDGGVAATVQKTIVPSTADDPLTTEVNEAVNKWYAIASPINPQTIAGVTGLTTNTHNLYAYDAPNIRWQDYRQETSGYYFTSFTIGKGYLYRTLTTTSIAFNGTVNANNVEDYALSYDEDNVLKSFNLLGNPYTHNITWANMVSSTIADGYYLLIEEGDADENKGKWSANPSTTAVIAPMRAFLVQATAANPTITINNTAGGGKSRANNDNIMFSVKNSRYSDEAYAIFGTGYGLNKINHRNSEIPMIYIPQDGKDFAIAMMDDDTQAFNLNFEAKTTGKYTLSFKANGEFNYLHVIDRMTGEDVDMLLEGEYSFIGSPMDNASRFIVRLGYLPNYDDNGEDIFAYQSGSDVVVSGEGELHIFDVMGRMIATQRINGVETINLSTNGVYIFRLNGNTQKIVVK